MSRTKAVVSLLLVVLALACRSNQARPGRVAPATPATAAPTAAAPVDASIPADERTDVARAIALGDRLFVQDDASARATDAALAGGLPAGVHGWITRETAAGWQVDFVGASEGRGMSFVTVPLDRAGRAGEPVRHDPPLALDEVGQAMFAARATAIAAFTPICGPGFNGNYNVDVVPASVVGASGWYVYFTPGTKDPDAIVLAGHARIAVDAAGTQVTDVHPLSRTCVVVDRAAIPSGGEVAALTVTHFVTNTPTEAHVFASLLYRTPIWVVHTDGRLWMVDGRHITREDSIVGHPGGRAAGAARASSARRTVVASRVRSNGLGTNVAPGGSSSVVPAAR